MQNRPNRIQPDLLDSSDLPLEDVATSIQTAAPIPHVLKPSQRKRLNRCILHLNRMGELPPQAYRLQLEREGAADIPSRKTLYAWKEKFKEDPMLLAGKHFRAGRRTTVADGPFYFYLDYRTNYPNASSKEARHEMGLIADKMGWGKLHSEDRYRAIYKALSPSLRCHLEKGNKARFEKYGFTLPQPDGLPNQIWACDSKKLDCYVRRFTGGKPFKPWLVSFFDLSSRMVMGWVVLDHTPTTRDVLLALKHALLPDGRKPWFGFPDIIRTDNGSIFLDTFTSVTGALGIKHQYIDKASPVQNGRIERSHRTHDEEFCHGFYKHVMWQPVKNRAPKLIEFDEIWERLEERFYSHVEYYCQMRPHSSLGGQTPYEVWKASVPTSSLQDRSTQIDKNLVIAHPKELKVERGIVTLEGGERYSSPELLRYSGCSITLVYPPEGPSSGKVRAFFGTTEIGVLRCPDHEPKFAQDILDAAKKGAAGEREMRKLLRAATNKYGDQQRKALGCINGEEPEPEPEHETPCAPEPPKKRDRIADAAAETYPEDADNA